MLAFEIFIPLVLFFILLGLRQKKPTIPVKEGECQWGGACGTPRLWEAAPAPWGQPGGEGTPAAGEDPEGLFGAIGLGGGCS